MPTLQQRFEEKFKFTSDNESGKQKIAQYIQEPLLAFLLQEVEQAREEGRKEALQEVQEVIKDRTPNEYGVRQYKTLEARSYDEKMLVIEALSDLQEKISALIEQEI